MSLTSQHEGNLRHHLKSAGIPSEGSPSDWVNNEEVKRYILGAMRETAKIGGLNKSELIKDVILTPEEWSVESSIGLCILEDVDDAGTRRTGC